MNDIEFVKLSDRSLHPVIRCQQHVAVEPSNLLDSGRHRCERNIEKSLFLPHHIGRAQLDQDLGVAIPQVETFTMAEFDDDQGDSEPFAKNLEVLKPPPVPERIEVAADDPEIRIGVGHLHDRCEPLEPLHSCADGITTNVIW